MSHTSEREDPRPGEHHDDRHRTQRPALLAGEQESVPDHHIFRGTD